jgi:hypothetical protein
MPTTGAAWTVKDVQAESGLRLYRAAAESLSILATDDQPDHRITAHLELNPRQPH